MLLKQCLIVSYYRKKYAATVYIFLSHSGLKDGALSQNFMDRISLTQFYQFSNLETNLIQTRIIINIIETSIRLYSYVVL